MSGTCGNTDLLAMLERDPPYWAGETILEWPGDDWLDGLKPFARSHYWNESGSLNVRMVVGTDHPDYQGKSWAWLLRNGKRMTRNLKLLDENPDYYFDTKCKTPSMNYISVNGHDWFVYGDGNHRTCIGQFFLEDADAKSVHGVCLSDWRIDYTMRRMHQQLREIIEERRLPFGLHAGRKTESRADGSGWQLEKYALHIELRSGGRCWRVKTDTGASRMREFLESSRFRRWHAMRAWDATP